ncbi:MAG: hypothetical protein LBT59_07350, partial [Clostridiales bacterium]|nr:hypothetical protein [Clostridiales bacterium]
ILFINGQGRDNANVLEKFVTSNGRDKAGEPSTLTIYEFNIFAVFDLIKASKSLEDVSPMLRVFANCWVKAHREELFLESVKDITDSYARVVIDNLVDIMRTLKGDRNLLSSLEEAAKTDEDFFEFSEEMTNLPEEALFYSAQIQHNFVEGQMKERIRNAIEFHQDNEPVEKSKRLHLPLDFVDKLKPVKTFKGGKNLYYNYMLEKFKFARGKLDTGASIEDIVAETGLSTEAVTSLQRYSDDESIERKLDELVHWNWNNLYNKDNDDEQDEE